MMMMAEEKMDLGFLLPSFLPSKDGVQQKKKSQPNQETHFALCSLANVVMSVLQRISSDTEGT